MANNTWNRWLIGLSFIFFLTLVSALAVTFHRSILLGMGNYLITSNKIRGADIIVALGGEKIRNKEAVRLLKKGYAPFILFTGYDIEPEDYLCLGVPPSQIIMPPIRSYTTHDEAIATLKVMKEKRLNSAIVVTSPYHIRRTSLAFNQVFKNSQIKVIVHPSGDSGFKMNSWWKTHLGRKVVLTEYIGILYYLAVY